MPSLLKKKINNHHCIKMYKRNLYFYHCPKSNAVTHHEVVTQSVKLPASPWGWQKIAQHITASYTDICFCNCLWKTQINSQLVSINLVCHHHMTLCTRYFSPAIAGSLRNKWYCLFHPAFDMTVAATLWWAASQSSDSFGDDLTFELIL